MSNVTRLSTDQTRYDEASLWVAKLDRELTPQEKRELGAWINECRENRELLLKMTEHWDKMDSLSRLSAIFPHHPADQSNQQREVGLFQLAGNWLGSLSRPMVATPLIVLIAAAIMFTGFQASEITTATNQYTYETAIGDQSVITLPDGSQIRLNTNTLVEVTYSSEQRFLNLIRGELNIEVAHEATRPLRVQANGRIVEAVGTAFNVEITEDQEVELVVTEGKVVVTLAQNATLNNTQLLTLPNAESPQIPSASASAINAIAVSAGEEILLGSTDQELKKILPEETVIKLSWQQGDLVFRGESLEEAMTEVGRYTTVEFVFLDEKSKHVRIAGLFKAGDTENLLSALRENFNVTHEWVDSEKVLLSSL